MLWLSFFVCREDCRQLVNTVKDVRLAYIYPDKYFFWCR